MCVQLASVKHYDRQLVAPKELSAVVTPRARYLSMNNREPVWNDMSQVYQLDFGGRVTQESAKNFQIEYQNKQVKTDVINKFTCEQRRLKLHLYTYICVKRKRMLRSSNV